MDLAVGDLDESRDIATQIQQRMELNGGLGTAEISPWEQSETQIDCRGIKGIDRLVEFNTKLVLFVKRPGILNENMGEIAVNSPISFFIRVGQGGPGNLPSDAHMVEFGSKSTQAAFDIPKAFPVSQLGKGHT